LLILDSIVSAGWETIAAAKPARRPDPKLTVVWALLDMVDLSKMPKIISAIFSKATNLVIV
jgi:hypothetical protein